MQIRKSHVKKLHNRIVHCATHYDSNTYLSGYILQFIVYHCSIIEETEVLLDVLYNEDFRQKQIDMSKQYSWGINDLRYAIVHLIKKEERSSGYDGHISWILLRLQDFIQEAFKSIRIIFEWFTQSVGLEEIFERLSILEPEKLYQCCLFLLWLEVEKQMQFTPENRDSKVPEKIIAFLKTYEKPKKNTMVSKDFTSLLMHKMYLTWENPNFIAFFNGLDDLAKDYLTQMQKKQEVTHSDWRLFIRLLNTIKPTHRSETLRKEAFVMMEDRLEHRDLYSILMNVENVDLRIETLSWLFEKLFQKGDTEGTEFYMSIVIEQIDSIVDINKKSEILQRCIAVDLQSKNDERAIELGKKVLDDNIKEQIIENIATYLISKTNVHTEQWLTLISLINTLKTEDRKRPPTNTIRKTIVKDTKIQTKNVTQKDFLQEIFVSLEDRLEHRDLYSILMNVENVDLRIETLSWLFEKLFQKGDTEGTEFYISIVIEQIDSVVDINKKSEILQRCIAVDLQSKNDERAIELGKKVLDDNIKEQIIEDIVTYLISNQKVENLEEIAKELSIPSGNLESLLGIIQTTPESQKQIDSNSANEIRVIQETETKGLNTQFDDQLLCKIASKLTKFSNIDEALKVLDKIQDEKVRLKHRQEIAYSIAQTGNIISSLQLLEPISDEFTKLASIHKVTMIITEMNFTQTALTTFLHIHQLIADIDDDFIKPAIYKTLSERVQSSLSLEIVYEYLNTEEYVPPFILTACFQLLIETQPKESVLPKLKRFTHIKNFSDVAIHVALALSKSNNNRYTEAKQVLDLIDHDDIKGTPYNKLLIRLLETGYINPNDRILDKITHKSERVKVLYKISMDKGSYDSAIDTIGQIKEGKLQSELYSDILRELMAKNESELLPIVLKQCNISEIDPVVLEKVPLYYLEQRRFVDCFRTMELKGFESNNELIAHLSQELVKEDFESTVVPRIRDVQDKYLRSSLIFHVFQTVLSIDNLEKIIVLYEQERIPTRKVKILIHTCSFLLTNNKLDKYREFLNKLMEEISSIQGIWHKKNIYKESILFLIDNEHIEFAMQLISTIDDITIQNDISIDVAQYLFQLEKIDDNIGFLISIVQKEDDRSPLYLQFGEYQVRQKQIKSALEIVELISVAKHKDTLLSAIALAQIETKQYDSALSCTSLIENPITKFNSIIEQINWLIDHQIFTPVSKRLYVLPFTDQTLIELSRIIVRLHNKNQSKLEFEIIKLSVSIGDNRSDSIQPTNIYQVFTRSLLLRGDIKKAKIMVEKIIDDDHRTEVIIELAKFMLEKHKIDLALGWIKNNPVGDKKWMVYVECIQVLLNDSQFDLALELALEIKDAAKRIQSLKKVSQAIADSGDYAKSIEVLQQIQHAWSKDIGISEIVKIVAEQEKYELAIQFASSISEDNIQSEAFASLLSIMVQKRQLDLVQKTLPMVTNVYRRYRIIIAYAIKMLEKSSTESSLLLIQDIADIKIQKEGFVSLCHSLFEQDRFDEALSILHSSLNTDEISPSYVHQMLQMMIYKNFEKEALQIGKQLDIPAKELIFNSAKHRNYQFATSQIALLTDQRTKEKVLERITKTTIENKDYEQAMQFAQMNPNIQSYIRLHMHICFHLLRDGLIEEGSLLWRDVNRRIEEELDRETVQKVLSSENNSKKSVKHQWNLETFDYFFEIQEYVLSLQDRFPSEIYKSSQFWAFVFSSIEKQKFTYDRTVLYRVSFHQDHISHDASMYIMKYLIQEKLLHEAQQILVLFSDSKLDEMKDMLILSLCSNGDWSLALEIFESMNNVHLKLKTFQKLLEFPEYIEVYFHHFRNMLLQINQPDQYQDCLYLFQKENRNIYQHRKSLFFNTYASTLIRYSVLTLLRHHFEQANKDALKDVVSKNPQLEMNFLLE